MADTITTAPVIPMPLWHVLGNALLQAVCRRRGHRWRDFGGPLPHGKRVYCVRCESQAVLLDEGTAWNLGGVEGRVECSKQELLARDPVFAEALYTARWGEPPRQRLRRGQWPAV